MNKTEVLEVVKAVEAYYPGKIKTDDPKALVIAWHRILGDYELNTVLDNLRLYAANNRYAPTISDLIKPPKIEIDRYVPTAEETQALLMAQEQKKEAAKNDPNIQEAKEKAKAEISKLLGIKRG